MDSSSWLAAVVVVNSGALCDAGKLQKTTHCPSLLAWKELVIAAHCRPSLRQTSATARGNYARPYCEEVVVVAKSGVVPRKFRRLLRREPSG